jgi:hypothetical protein
LEALKWKLFKHGKVEDIQSQEVDIVFLSNLEYRYAVLLRGMQYYLVDKVKVLLDKPCEKIAFRA